MLVQKRVTRRWLTVRAIHKSHNDDSIEHLQENIQLIVVRMGGASQGNALHCAALLLPSHVNGRYPALLAASRASATVM